MTNDGTATAGQDYVTQNGSFTLLPGQTTAVVNVPIIPDTGHEAHETFTVTIGTVFGDFTYAGPGTGTIIDDDLPGITLNNPRVAEIDGVATFTVTPTEDVKRDVTFGWRTIEGTAKCTGDARDFGFAQGTFALPMLTLPVLAPPASFEVGILQDGVDREPNEGFSILISNPQTGNPIAVGGGGATIIDVWADLDIDSDNDGDIDAEDDPIEGDAPGKLVLVSSFPGSNLVPLNIELSDRSDATVFPEGTTWLCQLTISQWLPENSAVPLLWRMTDSGLVQLAAWDPDAEPIQTVYVQGLVPGQATVELILARSINGVAAGSVSDAVKLSVLDVDIDTDSNNDGTVDGVNTVTEDLIEAYPWLPGRLVEYWQPNEPFRGENFAAVYLSADLGVLSPDGWTVSLRAPAEDVTRIAVWDGVYPGSLPEGDFDPGDPTKVVLKTWNTDILGHFTAWVLVQGENLGSAYLELVLQGSEANQKLGDAVHFTVTRVDLDMDSLNNDTLGSAESDWVEASDPATTNPPLPGRWVAVNDRDLDGDGVVDFADGIDLFGNSAPSLGQYTQLQFTIPEFIDPAVATIQFDYEEADPTAMQSNGPFQYSPAPSGNLVIWTSDIFTDNGKVSRKSNSISNILSVGHRVVSSVTQPIGNLGIDATHRTVTLCVEGIRPSANIGTQTITVNVDLDGAGPNTFTFQDLVRLTIVQVDALMDSDNSGPRRAGPDGSLAEDQIEEVIGEPGKIIPINDGDKDGDGIRDFVDGFDVGGITQGQLNPENHGLNASAKFTPIVVTIPEPLDLSKVKIKFLYDASAPSFSTDTDNDGVVDTPAPGRARLWTKDGDVARKGSNPAPGDYIDTELSYSAAELGFGTDRTHTFYVEGIRRSERGLGDTIIVEIDPDPESGLPFRVRDCVNYTVANFVMEGEIQYDPGAPKAVRGAMVTAVLTVGGSEVEIGRTWTSDRGRYSLSLLDVPGQDYTGMQMFAYAQSRDVGTATGQIRRGVSVEDDDVCHNVDLTANIATLPTVANPIGAANVELIAAADAHGQAFWVFDAAVTASRFHGRFDVPYLMTPVQFPSDDSYHLEGEVYIAVADFKDWDVIVHEYGHVVQGEMGSPPSPGGTHWLAYNLREQRPDLSQNEQLILAFKEGFADYFSMVAQAEEGVSKPPVRTTPTPPAQPHVAGDALFYTYPVEPSTVDGRGEDEELSAMRILWDLYDPANESSDRVRLTYEGIYNLLKGNGIGTLHGLWQTLLTRAGGNTREILDFAAIFQEHNVSPRAVGVFVTGGAEGTWGVGANLPLSFQWDIPQGSPERLGSPHFPAAGNLLDSFGIKIFDENYTEVYDVPSLLTEVDPRFPPSESEYTVVGNRAEWIMPAADRLRVLASGQTYHWIVYGGWYGDGSRPVTGPYWSTARNLSVTD